MFPEQILQYIEEQVTLGGPRLVRQCAEELSQWYRDPDPRCPRPHWTSLHYLAYAAVRMPATFSVAAAVLDQLYRRLAGQPLNSLLDLCAGPGTVAWSATAGPRPGPSRLTLVEYDAEFIALGRRLASLGASPALKDAEWVHADLACAAPFACHDLVAVSYGLGEVPPDRIVSMVDAAWAATRVALVLIEPGTPAGFRRILECRERLVTSGAAIAAPCPHDRACPWASGQSWCHFAERLPRSRLHRLLKAGDLGYEDEKYTYLVASRVSFPSPAARIIGHPRLAKSGVMMDVCATDGAHRLCIARRDREAYRRARRVRWGDEWETETAPEASRRSSADIEEPE